MKTVFKSTSKSSTGPQRDPAFSVAYSANAYIFNEGDLGAEMFIVQDGKVEILKTLNGEEQRLAVLSQGDFFGEMSVLEDLPRTASARAVTDCTLLRINGSTFDQMLRKNPEVAVRMMRKLSRRLRDTDNMLRRVLGAEVSPVPEMPVSDPSSEQERGTERLLHDESSIEFFLAAGPETTIGRRDPVTGINPDIDLTPADGQRSISRRHAKIFRREDKFFIREEIGTMNGTFINDERVETGVPVEFTDGDEVRFGLIRTVFRRS